MESKKATRILELPPDIRLQYLAEGNANIIYRILHPPNLASERRLLRLHKTVPWIPSYARLHDAYIANIAPLFTDDQLVAQELVRVPTEVFIRLNAELGLAEQALPGKSSQDVRKAAQSTTSQAASFFRPASRHGVYLDETDVHGMLITDMTANGPGTESGDVNAGSKDTAIEFKPKWLAQSPNAPSGSRRCRTCALHALRLSSKPDSDRKRSYFCPLRLVFGDRVNVAEVAQSLLDDQVASDLGVRRQPIVDLLTEYLLNSDLLSRLAWAQRTLDPHGILGSVEIEKLDVRFLTATTLRDCTLFLRISSAGRGSVVDAKLGDLDLKEPEPVKVAHWHETERKLIEGGWYSGAARLPDGDALICHLDKEHKVIP